MNRKFSHKTFPDEGNKQNIMRRLPKPKISRKLRPYGFLVALSTTDRYYIEIIVELHGHGQKFIQNSHNFSITCMIMKNHLKLRH